MHQLTQKEQMYLKDAKKHEELCVAKYNHYTSAVSCQELKKILQYAGQQEANHLQSVTQMMQGQIPQMGGGQQGQYGQQGYGQGQGQGRGQGGHTAQYHNQMGQQHMGGQGSYQQYGHYGGGQGQSQGQSYTGSSMSGTEASKTQYTGQGQLSDEQICNDLLTTEKAISDMYDHAVFESSNQQMRQALNHIQKEEQEHAFAIFQYMQNKGWYQ